MVKLVDMPDLGSGAARRVGSSPIIRTKKSEIKVSDFFYALKSVNFYVKNLFFQLKLTDFQSVFL